MTYLRLVYDEAEQKEKKMNISRVVAQEEWLAASKELLAREKEFTRQRDALGEARRNLPRVRVDKEYTFDGPNGTVHLGDLFEGRSQLIVYHFMFAPNWDEGCDGCSFVCDHVDAARQHFEHHDVSFAAVARASLAKLEAYKQRMSWTFPWVSSGESDFNYDFQASFRREDLDRGPVLYNFKMQTLKGEDQPGLSVFLRGDKGEIYHTYSSYERGLDLLLGAYNFIDLTPVGRNESGTMEGWMKRHDTYNKS